MSAAMPGWRVQRSNCGRQRGTSSSKSRIRDAGSSRLPLCGPHATEKQEHIGLRGMRERAALVGGKLLVESQPGAGTRVRVEVRIHE